LASLSAIVVSSPTPSTGEVAPLVVWDPRILYPKSGVVWVRGQSHNVTWDTSDAPSQISEQSIIRLRKGDSTQPTNLAAGFDLRSGRQQITIPTNIPAGSNYRVVLFGDSGNWSDQFTI
ncbi:hypothetical protein AURDEDRAFT_32373, partial [Auricularia subglabra TFB-10046 SS5]